MAEHAYLIPLLPLFSGLIIFFFGKWLPKKGAPLGILAIGTCFLMSIDLFLMLEDGSLKIPFEMSWTWFSAGIFPFEWGVLLDGPSVIMLLVVTTVSLLVQIYSLGYMHDAPRFKRFYAYLSVFTAAMLALVLANNYLQFFIGWEVMGACSYLLISFEFERESAAAAGNKAFLTTKLGDLGLYAGLLSIFLVVGSLNFGQIQNHLADGSVSPNWCLLISLLLFAGAVGKSAQFPLHIWLPDAMEGPTPVSALIHAATMVAAGIYLEGRTYGFIIRAPMALTTIAWVGGFTAFFAATIALVSDDIKKVLAYSTISQLGYMIMAMGVLGYSASLFHLTTHAAFKALLFLGAGSVIHAVHTNDMWKMGSLSKQMMATTLTFFVGSLALAGVPPFAGFYSKDLILSAVYEAHHPVLFGVALCAAFMTAFYMTRACALTFLGEPRDKERFVHAHESEWSMTIPLMVLAFLATLIGILMHLGHVTEHLLEYPSLPAIHEPLWIIGAATGSALLGIALGWYLYVSQFGVTEKLAVSFAPVYNFLKNKWYIDELYGILFIRPTQKLAEKIAWFDYNVVDQFFIDGFGWVTKWLSIGNSWVDDKAVDGAVDGTGFVVNAFGAAARKIQTGFVQNYLFVITVGFMILVFWKIF